jgi:hypothetical protein
VAQNTVAPYILTLAINGARGGKRERWLLDSANYQQNAAQLITDCKDIAFGRTAFFAKNAQLVYVNVSLAGVPRDRNPIPLNLPMGPHPSFTSGGGAGDVLSPINTDEDAIYTVAQVAAGMGANRYLNFLPSNWIFAEALAVGILPYLQPAPAAPAPGALQTWGGTHVALCQAWWALLMAKSFVGGKVTPTTYTKQQITTFTFRTVTDRDVGRPFGIPVGRRPAATIR